MRVSNLLECFVYILTHGLTGTSVEEYVLMKPKTASSLMISLQPSFQTMLVFSFFDPIAVMDSLAGKIQVSFEKVRVNTADSRLLNVVTEVVKPYDVCH